MSATTAALITGGASLLGGIMGRKKGPSLKKQHRVARESQQKLARDLPKYIVAGALKAGFNPLTVLGATGGQVGSATQATPIVGTNNFIQDALTTAADAYVRYDPIAEETRRLQNEIAQEELSQIRNEALRFGNQVRGVRTTQSPIDTNGQGRVAQPAQIYPVNPPPEITTSALPRTTAAAISPDYSVRLDDESLAEFETQAAGAAMAGQLPEMLRDLGEKNYPRTTEAFTTLWGLGMDTYDAAKKVGSHLANEPFVTTRPAADDAPWFSMKFVR